MTDKLINNIEYTGIFVGVILLTILIAYLVNRLFIRLIRKSTEDMRTDPTNYKFLRHAVVGLVYMVGFSIAIYAMPNLRALASSLLAGAGILAVAVGFASQHALSNIVSGVFIIIFRPFRVNDRLQIQQYTGTVEDITLRHTVIRNFENRRILLPNTVISQEIIVNADFTDTKICKWIEIGISYSSDIDLARKIMMEEVLAHPMHIDPRTPEEIDQGVPPVRIKVVLLGDSAVILRAWAWTRDHLEAFEMHCDLNESIKKRFDREGIEIPFPHRTLVYKNLDHAKK